MSERIRAAILVSGRGSNMAALLEAARNPAFPVRFVCVVSNVVEAPALAVARAAGLAVHAIDHRPFGRERPGHEAAVNAVLGAAGLELVCLAGYMRRLTPLLVDAWAGRMLNIHPSLLPAFPGLHTHERALAAGVRLHGCTVHQVTAALDAGPIVAQAAVPVLAGDDPARLGARVLAAEHRLFPAAVAAFVDPSQAQAPLAEALLCHPLPLPPGTPRSLGNA